jgi:hypothetical protein
MSLSIRISGFFSALFLFSTLSWAQQGPEKKDYRVYLQNKILSEGWFFSG